MTSIASQNIYNFPEKYKCREWQMNKFLESSTYIGSNGKLLGKLLEPVGKNAECFEQRKSYISESELIGLNINDDIDECKRLYPSAKFYNQHIDEFCNSDTDYIKYIIYDLYTSFDGKVFRNDMNAIMALIRRSLDYYGQIFLVISSDVRASVRHNTTKDTMIGTINELTRRHKLPKIEIQDEYEYQNTIRSDRMLNSLLIFSN